MGAFDVESPNWGRIAPVKGSGPPAVGVDGVVVFPTDAGPLRVSLLESGARLRLGPDGRDYGILLKDPPALAARVEALDGGTRLVAGDRVRREEETVDGRRMLATRTAAASGWFPATPQGRDSAHCSRTARAWYTRTE